MTTAKERIEQILDEKNLKIQELVDLLGVNRATISSVKNMQTKSINPELSDKIVSTFPEYSELWLLTGKEPKYAISMSGDTNIDVDMSEGKRENSGSGNYYEGVDAACVELRIENERLKIENEHLKDALTKSEEERKQLLNKLLN